MGEQKKRAQEVEDIPEEFRTKPEEKAEQEAITFPEVPIFTGQPEGAPASPGERLLKEGHTLQQTRTGYQTAVAVQKPRNIMRIQEELLEEARKLKELAFYRWAVGGKRPGWVEGGSIALAERCAHLWGNGATHSTVYEVNGKRYFNCAFVDLEKGYTSTRSFPIKEVGMVGYDKDRADIMSFQKQQSQALRRVIFAVIPKWMEQKAIEEAKKAMAEDITDENLKKKFQEACDILRKDYKITKAQVLAHLDKKLGKIEDTDIAKLRWVYISIRKSESTIEEMFPPTPIKKTQQETK